jgi:ATP-dependent RNA helicase DDX23/PRP28
MQRAMTELTDEQAEQAALLARIAERAEAKAASRARVTTASTASTASSGSSSSSNSSRSGSSKGSGSSSGSSGSSSGSSGSSISSGDDGKKAILSLDEMVALKKAEKAAANKVVFLTKAQRQEEALARMEEKRKQLQKQRDEARALRASFLNGGSDAGGVDDGGRGGGSSSLSDRDSRDRGGRDRDSASSFDRSRGGGSAGGSHPSSSSTSTSNNNNSSRGTSASAAGDSTEDGGPDTFEHRQQLKAIKEAYLGTKTKKKRIMKPSEKFARIFQFDWEAGDDTSQDLNPLYQERANVALAFGRGYRAGIDMREQRKHNTYMTDLTKFRQQQQRQLEDEQRVAALAAAREGGASASGSGSGNGAGGSGSSGSSGGSGGSGGSGSGSGPPVGAAGAVMSSSERAALERQRAEELDNVRRQQARIADDMDARIAREKGKHWTEKSLEDMSERDWRIFREDYDIRIKGGRATNPIRSWAESGLDERILQAFAAMNFKEPSPIQRQAIPIGIKNRDIIGIAETGSGKTAAFVAPMLTYILKCPLSMRKRTPLDGPLSIIMAPARELAQQIETETVKIAQFLEVSVVSMVGGQSIHDQGFKIREGCDVLIATPGRVIDALENHYVVLNQCNYIVLDEADRMIDMGFESQVNKVMDSMATLLKAEHEEEALEQAKKSETGEQLYRVTSLYSATMPPGVERVAKRYLRAPCIIRIGDEESGKNKRIDQRVLWMTEAEKKKKLLQVLEQFRREYKPADGEERDEVLRTIVFVNQKKACDVVARALQKANFFPTVLHGGRNQDAREAALADFKAGEFDILVATDVAGRGLDIPNVRHVINFDMANDIEKYTHRIGRTGRAGKSGVATTFLTEEDEDVFYGLKQHLKATGSKIPRELDTDPKANAKPGEFVEPRKRKQDQVQFAR